MTATSRPRTPAYSKRRATGTRPLARLRKLCLSLPEAQEVEAWGEPTFRVRSKLFAMYAAPNNHHGGGRPAVWCKAGPGNQAIMVKAAPRRFFVPPYVGPSGWIGVWLDGSVDWSELADPLRDAYALVAPKRLRTLLDEQ
jgi:predicted DNA-binding protein (MmcQ/YjbR family)